MKRIYITVVPHAQQRYDTVGDWTVDGRDWIITVSDTGNWKANVLIALHELVEMTLCFDRGITAQQVDNFDLKWISHNGIAEPGNDPQCPYEEQHRRASMIEGYVRQWLNLDLREYYKLIDDLGPGGPPKLTREQKLEAFVAEMRQAVSDPDGMFLAITPLRERLKLLD